MTRMTSLPQLRPIYIKHKNWDINTIEINSPLPSAIKEVKKKNKKAFVLVFSGGGMKALAHIGAVAKLKEILKNFNKGKKTEYQIDAVVASSGGNLTGLAFCQEWSIKKIREISESKIMWRYLLGFPDRFGSGLFSMEPLEKRVSELGPVTFDQLKIPLVALAYVKKRAPVIGWGKEPLGSWIRGACSAKFRVIPMRFIDKNTSKLEKMLDIGDFGADWCNPIGIARYIFPSAKILSIDTTKSPKRPIFKMDGNIRVIRPYNKMNIFVDIIKQLIARPEYAYKVGYESVMANKKKLLSLLEKQSD